MPKYLNTTTLSISNFNMDCDKVVELMRNAGITGSVTKTSSVVCSGEKSSCTRTFSLEPGCRIVGLKDDRVKSTWNTMKKHFNLDCAHVSRPGFFSGCIHDYISVSDDSKCPGFLSER